MFCLTEAGEQQIGWVPEKDLTILHAVGKPCLLLNARAKIDSATAQIMGEQFLKIIYHFCNMWNRRTIFYFVWCFCCINYWFLRDKFINKCLILSSKVLNSNFFQLLCDNASNFNDYVCWLLLFQSQGRYSLKFSAGVHHYTRPCSLIFCNPIIECNPKSRYPFSDLLRGNSYSRVDPSHQWTVS